MDENRKARYAAMEASREARESNEPPRGSPTQALSEIDLRLPRAAETAVVALRAVLLELSPSPAWRAVIADMTADALSAAKAVCPRDVWAEGWKLVYIERERRARWRAATTA